MREIRMLRLRWRGLETRAMDGIGSHFTTERVKMVTPDLRLRAPVLDPTEGTISLQFTVCARQFPRD